MKVTMDVRCQQDLLFSSQTCRVFESDLPIYWVSPSYLSGTFSILTKSSRLLSPFFPFLSRTFFDLIQPFLFLSPTFRILTQSFSFTESAHPIFSRTFRILTQSSFFWVGPSLFWLGPSNFFHCVLPVFAALRWFDDHVRCWQS